MAWPDKRPGELPPDIEGIRKILEQLVNGECPLYPECIKPKAKVKECDDCAMDGFISKLTKHGVVVLDKDQKFPQFILADAVELKAVETYAQFLWAMGWRKVVNLDGTVKEG